MQEYGVEIRTKQEECILNFPYADETQDRKRYLQKVEMEYKLKFGS